MIAIVSQDLYQRPTPHEIVVCIARSFTDLAGEHSLCLAGRSGLERDGDAYANMSPVKLSPPQKRRRRLMRQAVRESIANTENILGAIPFLCADLGAKWNKDSIPGRGTGPELGDKSSDHDALADLSTKVDAIDVKLTQVLSWLQLNGSIFNTGMNSGMQEQQLFHEADPGQYAGNLVEALVGDRPERRPFPGPASISASSFNASAVEFMPGVRTGDFRSLPPHGWLKVHSPFTRDEDTCATCRVGSLQCVCHDVFCRHCFKPAAYCTCGNPLLERRSCTECGWQEDAEEILAYELGDGSEIQVLPTSFQCSVCNGTDYNQGEFYTVQNAHPCAMCHLLLDQQSIQWCANDGRGCQAEGMYHRSCMHEIRQEGRPSSYVCHHCFQAGHVGSTDLSDSDASSEEAFHKDDITCGSTQGKIPDTGWPDFNAHQIHAFQGWAQQRRVAQVETLERSINHELDQAERAETQGDVSESRARIERAKAHRSAVNDLTSTEHLRKEAWKFTFSHVSSPVSHQFLTSNPNS